MIRFKFLDRLHWADRESLFDVGALLLVGVVIVAAFYYLFRFLGIPDRLQGWDLAKTPAEFRRNLMAALVFAFYVLYGKLGSIESKLDKIGRELEEMNRRQRKQPHL